MRLRARSHAADQAERQWDAFIGARPPLPAVDPGADFTTTIARLHAGDDAPAVTPTFAEELLARLISGQTTTTSTNQQQERIYMDQTIDRSHPAARGRVPAVPARPVPMPPRRRDRGWIELSAILVVVVLIGTTFFGRGPGLFKSRNEGAFIPAASTPIGLATPEVQLAGPVLAGQARGNAARTGVYPGAGPVTQPEIVWQQEMRNERITPTLVVDGGRVFLLKSPQKLDDSPLLWAFDLQTGDELWSFPVNWTNNSMLAAANGWVYVSRTDEGGGEQPERIVALNAETGAERWSYPIGVANRATLTVTNDTVYVVGAEHVLHAIDATTGAIRWTFELTGKPSANPGFSWKPEAPAVWAGTVYAPAIGGVLYAIDTGTGTERWRIDTDSDNLAVPAVDNGVIYLSGVARDDANVATGRAYALDAATGTERWRSDVGALQTVNPPVVGDDLILVSGWFDDSVARVDDESTLGAYDRESGEMRWGFTSSDGILDPVLANGVLYAGFAEGDGELRAYDAASGDLLWSVFTGIPETEPVIVDGKIVVSTYNGMLLVLGSAEGESTPVAANGAADVSGLPPCDPTRPNLTALPAGTAVASLAGTQARTRGGLEIKVGDTPEGDPADAEVVASIEEVLGRIADCEQRNATSTIIPSGFFSDDFYRRGTMEGRVFVEGLGSSLAPMLGGPGSSARSVSEVRELEDGRYAAMIMTSET
ncbi:MAG: PQQ-binding-like beta-propeller repeat protein, partial [Thermomicrobiales bacterium]|nr:PQQ-binding-like beta-propeller repeat protein [Thermomicrobiales bacterium]